MSERYGYDPYGRQQPEQPQILGYDEYGQPIYRQEPENGYPGYAPQQPQQPQQPQPQEPYGGGTGAGDYGAAGQGAYEQGGAYAPDPYGQQGYAYDPYGQQQPQQAQQQTYPQQDWVPQQSPAPERERFPGEGYQGEGYQAGPYGAPQQGVPGARLPGQRDPYDAPYEQPQPQDPYAEQPQTPEAQGQPSRTEGRGTGGDDGPEYRTEQFAFVEEQAEESEDVIDWLKFSESRTERREEAKRRGRNRVTALIVVLVLAVVGGAGYLWYAGKLPGLGGESGGGGTSAGQQRDVIAVHLRSTDDSGSSTALLVDNADAKRGTTVLLPNTLAVSTEDGTTTTLGKSVEDEGAAPTREALGTLLGADIKGTWRLDTPYLENLVEQVGGIALTTDAAVPGKRKSDKPLVERGENQDLDGRAAVAYSTYRAPGEPEAKQLSRFGQVMRATLRKLSSDPKSATRTVEALGQIPDPSLSEGELGTSLAKLAEQAKNGAYETEVLPARANGTLSSQTSDGLVKRVLGGTVKNSDPDAAPRVKITNASGSTTKDDAASAAMVNSGYTVVDGGAAGAARSRSLVTYGDAAHKAKATEVAETLGLPGSAVREGEAAANADVTVVLGRDYKG
ncbi:LCP family protein [Streptomyces sp. NPDC054796]